MGLALASYQCSGHVLAFVAGRSVCRRLTTLLSPTATSSRCARRHWSDPRVSNRFASEVKATHRPLRWSLLAALGALPAFGVHGRHSSRVRIRWDRAVISDNYSCSAGIVDVDQRRPRNRLSIVHGRYRNDARCSEPSGEIRVSLHLATSRYAPTGFRFRRGNPWGFKSLLEHSLRSFSRRSLGYDSAPFGSFVLWHESPRDVRDGGAHRRIVATPSGNLLGIVRPRERTRLAEYESSEHAFDGATCINSAEAVESLACEADDAAGQVRRPSRPIARRRRLRPLCR